ncbi:hypothetical protein AUJ95_05720 [Candidatus Desantisbacteria bacterium CG2_30_40_21]|uniref:DUF4325 domain-containing protein n=5 Tax=unclassified Candidatus Desantisiibacteriota TaxID=3106372 RepID=A0A2M7JAK3_9BACT|nr:MAG: hypothetical protein AUJ95_05720 [Candidatus Desantisbacteria bacterium CG2_30_40_21]PIP39872.1 MAG: hypothetical protein COX18_08585 [Candidatus Desantisbacteria bacterium CG23_combo_of_CG06-09_8_20_14_all_40_23]PIX16426.1 MAG: hypothetical protein COZ71_07755 [Candidatus Desantisbacteria bacterium CG_4_8_14_3_um_filter_40_12]PIY19680.1 MAG: hypothetical protein COZ13_04115 [Candidatus Desantisbacteria bacterium CG_4_10_14_3_um_filter_40_18]PJB30468.1 MAG: hypothetical protein CO110_00
MKLIVYDLIGENCLTLDDGQKIYDLIHPELIASHQIELDFDKAKVFASPFFNIAIGRLLKDIKSEDLNRLLKVNNLAPVGYSVLKRVIENSKEYYSPNENTRKALDAVLLEQSENL